jgi:hypothetical protein
MKCQADIRSHDGKRRRPPWGLVLAVLVSCDSYQPVVELWPNSAVADVGTGGGSQTPDVGAAIPDASTATTGNEGGAEAAEMASQDATSGDDGGTSAFVPDEGGISSATCSLSVTVTTVTDNGNYSPRNIGAIWIATGSGAFVKTLAVWASRRISHLTMWGSATAQAGRSRNTVDAITGATLSSHQTHKVTWNCSDTTKAKVRGGPYRVYFEMTDDNLSGPNMFVNFTMGSTPFNLSPPNGMYFMGINLVYAP